MDTLNAAQKQAATALHGPIAIIAGPGTGKTKTLVERVGHMVAAGVPPPRILALTFTKKAAEEMCSRLGNKDVTVATFHALCLELLRQKSSDVPAIITESARMALLRGLPKPAELKGVSVRDIALRVSRAKNMAAGDDAIMPAVAAYNTELAHRGLQDFDDVLLSTRDLLQNDATWRAQVQARFTYILVDEFQDTNALQYDLLQLIRGTDNVCVIGDPLQSIYGFRGADGDIFSRFTADFPTAVRVTLQTNYRSAQKIVALANAIYPDAPQLTAHTQSAGSVQTIEVLNAYSEAAWVIGSIERAIGGSDLQRAVSDDGHGQQQSLRDFAVLYRTRAAGRVIQKAVADSGLPYQIVGDGSPYETPQVQLIIQLLGRLADPERPVSIKDMNEQQVQALIETLDAAARPAATAERIIATCKIPQSAELQQFCGTLVRFSRLAEAVKYIDDIAAHGFYDQRADAITLLTIHAAKGLEFTHVFLVAVEDGVLPSARADTAEEKRLFYVAVTRAKATLDILHARSRGGEAAKQSQFVRAIAPATLPRIQDEALANDQRRAAKRHAKRAQASLF